MAIMGHLSVCRSAPNFRINILGKASYYPSIIDLIYPSTLIAEGSNPTVWINGLSHTFVSDVALLLKAPNGVFCMLMYAVSGQPCTNIDLEFVAGGTALPAAGPLTSGTYGPTNLGATGGFPGLYMPSPVNSIIADNYPTDLTALSGNGNWELYIADMVNGDAGTLDDWGMSISGSVPTSCDCP